MYIVMQSMVGTNPITGNEISLRPGDVTDWCPIEGARLIEAGIFSNAIANMPEQEVSEQTRNKRKGKETR
jgi:hypothetical protein